MFHPVQLNSSRIIFIAPLSLKFCNSVVASGFCKGMVLHCEREREFFIGNQLVPIHFIIVMIRWTGLAPWEFEFPFPGSLTSTFLAEKELYVVVATSVHYLYIAFLVPNLALLKTCRELRALPDARRLIFSAPQHDEFVSHTRRINFGGNRVNSGRARFPSIMKQY